MRQPTTGNTQLISKMQQQELPFEAPLRAGWAGKRYLLCSDTQWHLVLSILDGARADTQCCADVAVVLPQPDGSRELMCSECVALHFAPKKKAGQTA